MVEFKVSDSDVDLDQVFAALADRTRRAVLQKLGGGERTVSELAEPHGMSLTGFMKHLRVLEDAGLVARNKQGRVVSCALSAAPLQEAAVWLSRYEQFWTERFDALGRYLYQQKESSPCRPSPPPPTSAPSSGSSATSKASSRSRSGARGPTRKR